MATQQMYQYVDMAPGCGFMVRSSDKDEVMKLAKMHMDKSHKDMKMDMDKIKDMTKTVSVDMDEMEDMNMAEDDM